MIGVAESTRPRSCAMAMAEALAIKEKSRIFFMVNPFNGAATTRQGEEKFIQRCFVPCPAVRKSA
jgi:hypothetical protein